MSYKKDVFCISGVALTGIISSTLPVVVHSQEPPKKVEEIIVTGSNIPRSVVAPSPITVIGGQDLQNAGITNVADLLNKLPSSSIGLSPETTNNAIFASGLNQTSLRGLGVNRTLVLVNGRRFVSGSSNSSAVDLNSIPTAIIERIEVVTGGASAVYGSDAIAGVVNIITRKESDGLELDVSYTEPEQNGGEKKQISVTYGSEFNEERGNFLFNVTTNKDEQIRFSDRNFTRTPIYAISSEDGSGQAQRISWSGLRKLNWLNYAGVINDSAENRYTFDNQGNLKSFNYGNGAINSHRRNRNHCTGASCDGFDPQDTNVLATPVERTVFNLSSDYDLTENFNVFTEVTYANSEAYGESSPVFHRAVPLTIDNAFIKDDLREVLTNANMEEFSVARLSTEFGNRTYNQERTTLRYVFGFKGSFYQDWGYSFYYQRGELEEDTLWTGQTLNERWDQAVDAIKDLDGNIVCRDQSNGCVPLNILGQNQASQAAIDWIGTTAGRTTETTQDVYSLVVNGSLLELPAGKVGVALSAQYRKESSETNPDAKLRGGLVFGNESLPMQGQYDVNEQAIEMNVPLLSGVFLADHLSLDLAYRYMDYSTAGNYDAWKVGLDWDVTEDLKFRATRSRSVRAPNVAELFSPRGQTFEPLRDVCRADEINNGPNPTQRLANCRAAGVPEGWLPSASWDQGNHPGYNQGNIDLVPEISNDYTLGFVYLPSFLEGFSVTVDYWSFEITDAINALDISDSIRYCYDSSNADNLFCQQFKRTAGTLDIDYFVQQDLNLASYDTTGVDVEVNYIYDTDSLGSFRVNLIGTYLDEFEFNSTGFPADVDVDVGEYTNPRWKARATFGWTYNDLYIQMLGKYRHGSVVDNAFTKADVNYNNIPSHTLWDLSSTYQVFDDMQVRFGILNVFDKEPPRNPEVFDGIGYYDTVGRAPFLGVNYRF